MEKESVIVEQIKEKTRELNDLIKQADVNGLTIHASIKDGNKPSHVENWISIKITKVVAL